MAGAAVRRVFWAVCACLLLWAPCAHASSRALVADFDGDGKSDWVAIDRLQPSVMHIWLSATGRTDTIRSHRAVLQIAARDMDGDHRPELITAEDVPGAAHALTRANSLRVWKQDAARGFRCLHPRRGPPNALTAPPGRAIHNDDPADDADGVAGSEHGREPATAGDCVSVPALSRLTLAAHRFDAAPISRLPFAPSAPRPPPAPRHS